MLHFYGLQLILTLICNLTRMILRKLDQQFDLDLWQRDLNINMEHLLLRGIHNTEFGDF